jgi:hypothetical protein
LFPPLGRKKLQCKQNGAQFLRRASRLAFGTGRLPFLVEVNRANKARLQTGRTDGVEALD